MYGRDVESMSNRSERRQVLFIFKVSCRFWDKVGEGGGEKRREREREEGRGGCIFTWPFPKEKEGWIGRSVCVYGKWEEEKRKRERGARGCDADTRERKRKRKREREKRWPTSSRGIQIHVDAAQSGVHHFSTYSHPPLPPTIRCYTLRPFSRSSSSTLVHPLLSI